MSLLGLLATGAGTPVDPPVYVTPAAPTADDTANTVTIPLQTGVHYQIGSEVVTGVIQVGDVTTVITVVAIADEGYELTGTTSWDLTFTGTAVLTPLHPGVTATTPPTPLAHWPLTEESAPYYTTTADLPLAAKTTSPVKVVSALGDAIYLDGSQVLAIPAANTGRLHIGADATPAVTVSAWLYLGKHGQVAVAGIWGEFADPPQRQYALFYDLQAYGGARMSCFHVSKDGAPTPGYPYSVDYSANPVQAKLARWHHMVGTYDGQEAVSYLDGIAYAHSYTRTRYPDNLKNPYTFPDGLNDTPHDFAVSTGGPLFGMMRDVRVWDTALTPGQVLGLYEATSVPPTVTREVDVTFEGGRKAPISTFVTSTTFTDLPIGTPRAGRLVVIAVAVERSGAGRKITAASIDGTPVSFSNPTVGNSIGFVHAVIPSGTTATLDVTFSADVAAAVALVSTLDGAETTPSAVAGSATVKTLEVPGSAAGGAILSVLLPGADNPSNFSPADAELWDGRVDGGMPIGLSVSTATGYFFPMYASRGSFGSRPSALAAIAFDPTP